MTTRKLQQVAEEPTSEPARLALDALLVVLGFLLACLADPFSKR